MNTNRINLPTTWVDIFFTPDGKIGVYQYSGSPERIIKELLQRIVDERKPKNLGGYDHPYFKR